MIYRVTGNDRRTGHPREVYIDAQSALEANECAWQRGIAGPKEEPVRTEDVPLGIPVIRPDRKPLPVDPQHSDLMTRPVWTIAKGVLLGLLLFVATMILLQLVLFLTGMTLVSLFS